jgi:hypothetical protein
LSSAPAADGTFPTIFCESFLRCPSPYPGGPTGCVCLVLPQRRRPSQTVKSVGFPLLSVNTTFHGYHFGAAAISLMLPGRTMARIGLRMMPPFPWSPLKSRTVSFPQYGFKAGMSDGAFPSSASSSRRPVCVRPSCPPLAASLPRSVSGDASRLCTSVRAAAAALPQGPSLRSRL